MFRAAPSVRAGRFGLPVIATIACFIVLFFLVGAMIVLALIPIYTKNHSVASTSLTSQLSTITIQVEGSSTLESRSRRGVYDLQPYIGAVLTSSSNADVGSLLYSYLQSSGKVSGVSVSSATIAYQDSSTINGKKKKRYALSKRAVPSSYTIVLVIQFILTYATTCSYSCQISAAPTLRSTLSSVMVNTFVATDVPVILNGVQVTIPRIQFITVTYVSAILPAATGSTAQVAAAITVTVPTNTTAAISG